MSDIGNASVFKEVDDDNNTGTPSWPEFMPAKNVNNNARALQGAIKRWYDRINASVTSSGSATGYTINYNIDPDEVYNGQRFLWIPHIDCGAGPVTLVISPFGEKDIVKVNNGVAAPLVAGDIQQGFPAEVVMDVANDRFVLMNPAGQGALVPNATESAYGTVRLASILQTFAALPASDTFAITVKTLTALWEVGAVLTPTGTAPNNTLTIPTGGLFHVAGTGWTITSVVFANPTASGREFKLVFNSAGGIIKDSGTLILPGTANITVKAGDVAIFVADGAAMRLFSYQSSGITTVTTDMVIKTANQTFPTLAWVDDAELFFTVKANLTYNFRAVIDFNSDSDGIDMGFTAPGISSMRIRSHAVVGAGATALIDIHTSAASTSTWLPAVLTEGILELNGWIIGGGSDSVFAMRWQQNNSGNPPTVFKNSYLTFAAR